MSTTLDEARRPSLADDAGPYEALIAAILPLVPNTRGAHGRGVRLARCIADLIDARIARSRAPVGEDGDITDLEARARLAEATNELHCCDDVPLDKGLAEGIASLRRERDEAGSSLETAERRIGELTTPVTITEHDDQMDTFLEGVEGVIEATGCEHQDLWECWHQREGMPWEQIPSGLMTQVGTFGGMPVCISLRQAKIEGHVILFYHATSLVVHNDIVRGWLEAQLPDTARRDGRLVHADAMNAINVMHTLRRAALTPDAGTARSEDEEG